MKMADPYRSRLARTRGFRTMISNPVTFYVENSSSLLLAMKSELNLAPALVGPLVPVAQYSNPFVTA